MYTSYLDGQRDVGVLQSVIGAHSQRVPLPRLPVERLGERQLTRGRVEPELALGFLEDLAGRPMIRHQGVRQRADRVRIERLQHRDHGVRRRLLGDFEFPGASPPGRRHVILVEDRHSNLQFQRVFSIGYNFIFQTAAPFGSVLPSWVFGGGR